MEAACTFCIISLLNAALFGSYGGAIPVNLEMVQQTVLGYLNASAPEILPLSYNFVQYQGECNYHTRGTAEILSLQTSEFGLVLPVSELSIFTDCRAGLLEVSAFWNWYCLTNTSELIASMRVIGSDGLPHRFVQQNLSSGKIRLSSTFNETGNGTIIILSRDVRSFQCLESVTTKFVDKIPIGWCATWVPKMAVQTRITYDKSWYCAYEVVGNTHPFAECIWVVYQQNTTQRIVFTVGDDYWKTYQKTIDLVGLRVIHGESEEWNWSKPSHEDIYSEILQTANPIKPYNSATIKNNTFHFYHLHLNTVRLLTQGSTLMVVQRLNQDFQCLVQCARLLEDPIWVFWYPRGWCKSLTLGVASADDNRAMIGTWNATFFPVTFIHLYNEGGEEIVLLSPPKQE
ncbi:hypothetical protein [Saguinine gammaherpesvirus 1]|uniref:Uncharacterized protein n=1 Tax=Saguinine gammaherpesvirus 1 TaxID=2169901 RepID=A0A9Q8QWE7_9GAMA|nr:hypothetical protein [Saguinine gammaherpesvirus 1]